MRKNVQGFSGYISIIYFPELMCVSLTLEKQHHMAFEKSLVLYLLLLLYELRLILLYVPYHVTLEFSCISTFKYPTAVFESHGGSDKGILRRLGKILHVSNSRSLIVKCDESHFVKLGTGICDSKLKEIGKVQDFFGPISSPYVSIRPSGPSPAKFVGRIAYTLD